jgi:hypothetical protein
VGACPTFSRAAWFAFGTGLAVPLSCGGKSTTLETENVAGDGSGGSGAGRGGSGGATTGSGATGSGATGGTGTGATGGIGTGGTGMGATGGFTAGTGATAGVGGPAAGAGGTDPIDTCPTIEPGDRACLVDSDCTLSAKRTCCGDVPVQGVSRESGCAEDPVACVAECARPRWYTDTNEITTDLGVVQVRCEFGERPDQGICTSYIDLDAMPSAYCNGVACAPAEVCVHYAPPGGPVPPCIPLVADGGTCSPGYQEGTCPESGVKGCIPVRLPECVAAGSSCGGPVDCECLPPDICGGAATECTGVMGRHVSCVDESP